MEQQCTEHLSSGQRRNGNGGAASRTEAKWLRVELHGRSYGMERVGLAQKGTEVAKLWTAMELLRRDW